MPGQFINTGTNPGGKLSLVNNSNSGNLSFSTDAPTALYTEYLILRLTAEPTIFPGAFPNTGFACASWTNPSYSFYSVYAAESSISSVTYLYTDSGLTTPVVNTSPSVAYNTIAVVNGISYTTPYSLKIINGTGEVSSLTSC